MNNGLARRTHCLAALALTAAPMMTVFGYGHDGWHSADSSHCQRRPMGGWPRPSRPRRPLRRSVLYLLSAGLRRSPWFG